MPDDTSQDYQVQIDRYAQKIHQSTSIDEIRHLLESALKEIHPPHAHNEVHLSREQVRHSEQDLANLREELDRVRLLIHADPMTGALNRRGLSAAFARESARADRHGASLCIAMIDLDGFKGVNDTYGHQAGDNVLLHLVNLARETLRPSDVIARYGGEEFVILLPSTGLDSGAETIRRLQRTLVNNPYLHHGKPIQITFSAGVALRKQSEPETALIERSDEAMYRAKNASKNCVMTSPSDQDPSKQIP